MKLQTLSQMNSQNFMYTHAKIIYSAYINIILYHIQTVVYAHHMCTYYVYLHMLLWVLYMRI